MEMGLLGEGKEDRVCYNNNGKFSIVCVSSTIKDK
jgi:hypothetical protein